MSEKILPVSPGGAATTVAPADVARIWAVMSHEIRTPLMGVVGMLEVLNRTNLTDEQRRIITTAEESSVTLMHIIDDVLDFAKLESTQVKLEEALADPVAVIEATADLLSHIAGAKRLDLTCEVIGNPPLVMCDALRLRQVLVNIGTNAVKYTDSGSVALEVSQIDQGAGTVTLKFGVADTGQGIPPDLQGYLFEPFWQRAGREASFVGMGGVGLGLAICRTLVDAMGGRIVVTSQAGRGTRFDVVVTLKKAAAETAAFPQLESTDVVAVESADATLAIALRYLENAGASIVRVNDLGAVGRNVPAPQRKSVVLIGAEAEAEDVEAAAEGLRRVGSDRVLPIVWLHRAGAGRLPARSGIWPVRAYPMRRGDLFAGIERAGRSHDGDGFEVVTLRQERFVDASDAAPAARADGLVLLVAEDNRVNQEVLRQQLAILGYDCDIAPTGHAALKSLAERRYPLLLCDCHMPGMDGFELTRIIRSNEGRGARMPIVAVTANAIAGEAARCRAAGMDDYLAKPIEIGALQAKLNLWLGPTQARGVWTDAAAARVRDTAGGVLDLRGLAVVYGNDPSRLAPVIEGWSAAMAEILGDLDASYRAKSWGEALAATHRLKGSAGLAGAQRLSTAAAALEVALRGADQPAITREMARVRALTEAGLKEVADWQRAVNL